MAENKCKKCGKVGGSGYFENDTFTCVTCAHKEPWRENWRRRATWDDIQDAKLDFLEGEKEWKEKNKGADCPI